MIYPGIGESKDADAQYFKNYAEMLIASDVVLWAIHSDNRSTAFDVESLDRLISEIEESERAKVLSKITFVLTKTDLITASAWIFCKINDSTGSFAPDPKVKDILKQKQVFYQETFIKPYSKYLKSETYNDCNFDLKDSSFSFDKYKIQYNGYLSESEVVNYSEKYPKYSEVFSRLFDNYEVVPCSSQFKYNLTQLMLVITNKLGDSAIGRFKKFTEKADLVNVAIPSVKKMCNILVFDANSGQTIFNFNDINI